MSAAVLRRRVGAEKRWRKYWSISNGTRRNARSCGVESVTAPGWRIRREGKAHASGGGTRTRRAVPHPRPCAAPYLLLQGEQDKGGVGRGADPRRDVAPSALTLALSRRERERGAKRVGCPCASALSSSPEDGSQSLPMRASTKGSISKSRRSARPSPRPISLTGMPSLAEMATTMPPLAVPSSLVRTRPVIWV